MNTEATVASLMIEADAIKIVVKGMTATNDFKLSRGESLSYSAQDFSNQSDKLLAIAAKLNRIGAYRGG